MSTPHDPQGRDPREGPGWGPEGGRPPGGPGGPDPSVGQGGPSHRGVPGQYGGPPQGGPGQPGPYGGPPGPYGQGPYGQGPHGQGPHGQPPAYGQSFPTQQVGVGPGQYAYNPYGSPTPYPAGLDQGDATPAKRPGIVIVSLVLLVLSALPFLAGGLILLIVPLSADTIPPELLNDPALIEAGATPDLLIQAFRATGVVVLVMALLYIAFAVLAFLGRNWARIVLTIMTVAYALLLGAGIVAGAAADTASLAFLLAVIAASVGGTVLLFLPASAQFFARRPRAAP